MKLIDYLSSNNITGRAFAAELGVPHSSLSRWINGKTLPRLVHCVGIHRLTKGAVQPTDFLPFNYIIDFQEKDAADE